MNKLTSTRRIWHILTVGKRSYIPYLALRLLWPRSWAQRAIALICVAGIAMGLMLQIVVRGVMDGMVREIEEGVSFCMPDLLLCQWSHGPRAAEQIPGIDRVLTCRAGTAATPHGFVRYGTWQQPALIKKLIISGEAQLKPGQALISHSLAEKANLSVGDILPIQLPEHTHAVAVAGIYRVPGRMTVPEVLLPPTTESGTPALAISLTPGADISQIVRKLKQISPQSDIQPTGSDTETWLRIIQRVKQTMGFILYLCFAPAAFAGGALLLIICHRHRMQLSILSVYGMPPQRLRLLILSMALGLTGCGIALGNPLACAVLHWREEIRQTLLVCGIDAFPVEVLDMPLPAHTTPTLYLTHSIISAVCPLLAALPAIILTSRLASRPPRNN